MNNKIDIITQAFYGNRVATEVRENQLDRFILGRLDEFPFNEKVDRTIIRIPNTNNLVLIYNKYREEEDLERKEQLLIEENYELKPLAVIPELDMKIYSRCIVCRMNENGNLESLEEEDYEKFMHYLAK